MQSFETYGFKMEYNDENSTNYLELKKAIEDVCETSKKLSVLYNKNPLVHYAKMENNYQSYITCIVTDEKVEFGIYQRKNINKILQNISDDSSLRITLDDIQALKDRMEIIAKNKSIINPEPIHGLWIELLKEKENNKNLYIEYEK